MIAARQIGAVARADFFERTRRYSYLVTLLVTIWATAMFLPPNHATYATLQFGGHRGIYNSAWIGSLTAMLSAVFLSFAGFYLVKNTIERDRATRVGPILAATSLGRASYLLGKMLSNFLVLGSMIAVLGLSALAIQLTLHESRSVDLVSLWLPLALVPLPLMMLTGAVAVCFETVPALRGGLGNIVYWIGWTMFLATGAMGTGKHVTAMDPMGTVVILRSMAAACAAAYPDYVPGTTSFSMGINLSRAGGHWDFTTFEWHGVHWNGGDVAARLIWVLVAIALTALSALWFDRFDDARGAARAKRGGRAAALAAAVDGDRVIEAPGFPAAAPAAARSTAARSAASLTPGAVGAFQLWPLWKAEFALLARGHNVGWYVVAATLALIPLVLPLSAVREIALPLAWIWPLLLWSAMGSRERREGTEGLLFSAARPVSRQLPAAWLAGVSVAVLMGGAAAVRLVISGDMAALGSWAAGALFVPSLALALGVWTGGRKLFEVLYLTLWYMGPMHHVPTIDYIGTTAATASWSAALGYFALTAALLALAAWGRARQVRAG